MHLPDKPRPPSDTLSHHPCPFALQASLKARGAATPAEINSSPKARRSLATHTHTHAPTASAVLPAAAAAAAARPLLLPPAHRCCAVPAAHCLTPVCSCLPSACPSAGLGHQRGGGARAQARVSACPPHTPAWPPAACLVPPSTGWHLHAPARTCVHAANAAQAGSCQRQPPHLATCSSSPPYLPRCPAAAGTTARPRWSRLRGCPPPTPSGPSRRQPLRPQQLVDPR